LFIVAAAVGIGFPVLSALSMQALTSAHAGVMLGILPLTTTAAAAILGRERPSVGFWLSAFTGAVVVIGFALIDADWQPQVADAAFLLAVIVGAFGYAVGGLLAQQMGGWRVICWAVVLAFPFVVVPTVMHAPSTMSSPGLAIWLWFLYLALGSQLFGFFFWNAGLALGGIARVSQTQLLQPFITLVISAVVVGETLNTYTWLFATLVVGTVAVGRRMPVMVTAGAQGLD
jgi:drug/metabolite transporter (DMT)-like permease